MTSTEIPAQFLDAPRAQSHGGFIHTCNGDVRSGLPFGRKAPGICARCWDMVTNGAAARSDFVVARRNPAVEDAARCAEIRAHFQSERHLSGKCGLVCTFADW